MKTGTSLGRYFVLGSLAMVYGVLLPLLVATPVQGHRMAATAVRNNRLDVYSTLDPSLLYDNLVRLAVNEWDGSADNVNVSITTDPSKADVTLVARCNRRTTIMGAFDPPTRTIYYNTCLMDHDGGRFGNQGRFPATPASRKARTIIHEIGHALGLDHTDDLDHRQSVMSVLFTVSPKENLRSWYSTVNLLRRHDRDDIKARW